MKKILIISILLVMLIGCGPQRQPTAPYGNCSGMTYIVVNKFMKDDKLFNVNNPFVLHHYGNKPTVLYKIINFTACSNVKQYDNKNDIAIFLDTPIYGSINYCRYKYIDGNKTGLMGYELFFKWAKLSYEEREKTKEIYNKKLLEFKCDWSTVPKEQSDWYFENEASTKEPIMVSNANYVTSYSILPNRTIALTLSDAKKLYNIINEYFVKQTKFTQQAK